MDSTRIKFCWAPVAGPAPRLRWRAGLFALHRQPVSALANLKNASARTLRMFQRATLHVSVRGALLWGATLAAVAYLAGAGVMYQIQRAVPHNRVTYADLVLPWRWSGLDELRGRAFIEYGRERFRAGDFSVAFQLLRQGVARHPADVAARYDLANCYLLMRVRTRADRVLLEAFDHGYPGTSFIESGLLRIREGDNPDNIRRFLDAARASWTAAGSPPADGVVIDRLELEFLLEQNRMNEAVVLAHRLHSEGSDERRNIDILVALGTGDLDRAAALAAEWERAGVRDEKTLAFLAGTYRKAGRLDAMQAVIDRLRDANPLNPSHVAFDVVQNVLAGRDERARAALDNGFFHFSSDPAVLAQWAGDISRTGRDDLMARIEDVVREHGFDPRAVLTGRLLVQMQARDWKAARVTADKLVALGDRMRPGERATMEMLTGLVDAREDPAADRQKRLVDAYMNLPVSLDFSRTVIEALLEGGRLETAGRIATFTEGFYPDSVYVADAVARIAGRTAGRDAAELAARDTSAASPADGFADGAAFLAAIDARVKSGIDPSDTIRLIGAVRRAAPAWLPSVAAELPPREIELAARAGDLPLLQLLVRTRLRADGAHATAIIGQARAWHRSGRVQEGLLVVREILRADPDDQAAVDLLALWEPKPAKAGAPAASGAAPAAATALSASARD